MGYLVFLVVIGTSIWVLVDAKAIGVEKGRLTGLADLDPWGWFFFCLLLWIIGFPYYVLKREELKRTADLAESGQALPETFVCPICSAENPLDEEICSNCSHSFV